MKHDVANLAFYAVERLADALFGDSEMTDELWEICDGLMDSAVHGTSTIRTKNSLDSIRNEHKRFAKLRYRLSRVFPSYDDMVWTYPQLESKKIMLPIYYLFGIFRIVFRQRYKIKQANVAIKTVENKEKPVE